MRTTRNTIRASAIGAALILVAAASASAGSAVGVDAPDLRTRSQVGHSCDSGPALHPLWRHCNEFPISLPITIQVNASGIPAGVSVAQLESATRGAIAAWAFSSSQPTFVYGGATSKPPGTRDGASVVGFGDPATCSQPAAQGVACLFFQGTSLSAKHKIVETDVILWSAETWRLANADESRIGDITGTAGIATAPWFDLQEFITHELGHAIGLEHVGGERGSSWPSDLEDAVQHIQTMYHRAYRGSTAKRTLDSGDQMGLKYVYDNM